jgi:trimeric autotransporter adhesin
MRTATRLVVLNSKKYALDLISAIVAAAYSLRRLYASYTGAAIRVRRSSDNAERDIRFIGEHLDVLTLLVFVGSGNGFITTWYDQSGNGRHATQTTAGNQPQIVSNGVIEKQNGRPALIFDGNAFFTNINVSLPQFSVSLVETATQNTSSIYYPVGFGTGGISVGGTFLSQKFAINGTNSLLTTENSVLNALNIVFGGSNNLGRQISVNGNAPATDATVQSITQITIGRRSDSFWLFFGLMSEVMFFPSLLSTIDRQLLERDQGIYFNISVS